MLWNDKKKTVQVTGVAEGKSCYLDILVENTGRANYGGGLNTQRKGERAYHRIIGAEPISIAEAFVL